MQQAHADSIGREIAKPWIRALKVPISLVGAVTTGVIGGLATAKLYGSEMSSGSGTLPVSPTTILGSLGLSYIAGALYSAVAHRETGYQQTQSLTERTVDVVQDATIKPLKKAAVIPVGMIVVGIPAAALFAFFAGKDAILEKLTTDNASKAIQALVAIFGVAGAIEYLRQLTDFASTKRQ